MSLFPALATIDLLPQADGYPQITPTVVVLHTNGGPGNPQQIRNYFTGKGVFSHFDVGWDGSCVQMQDTSREAPAEYAANMHAVSIETQDDGDPNRPWSPQQAATIIALLRALTTAHPIPRVLCPSPDGAGIGYHQQYRAWNRSAHDCPGPVRVRQLFTTILPALGTPPAPVTAPPIEENPMKPLLVKDTTGRIWLVSLESMTRVWVGTPDDARLYTAQGAVPAALSDLSLSRFPIAA